MAEAPKVSVVIAAYQPGDAVRRVIDSLDAQTLPQDEFEVIFVDDGSPDDTFDKLQRIASTRPNMQVHRIENSGWPSRPRNVGTRQATGEYVMYMDHDDSLYPDGLRRAYEYAAENHADVLSPKESKTNDVWWGMSSLTDGNIPNALAEEGIHRMLPMVPHKLYRRSMFLENNIRFPEGSRVLWEDWFINLDAYRHAKVISVLADTPVYLWHASDTNSSHTFSPTRVDFWDRLEEMMDYIVRVLAGPEQREAREATVAHQIRTRVIDRCVRLAARTDQAGLDTKQMALKRARKLIDRFTSDAIFARLPKKHQAQLHLMSTGDTDLVKSFHESDLAMRAPVRAGGARWDDGVLGYDLEVRWEPKDPAVPVLRSINGRVIRDVSPEVERAVPPNLLDVTDDADTLVVETCIRSRADYVTWALPLHVGAGRFEQNADGALSLRRRAFGDIVLQTAALGEPLDDGVWDVRVRTEWIGMERKGPLLHEAGVAPALIHGRAVAAYSNASSGLSLDLAQRLRTFSIDARPRRGPAGNAAAFETALLNVSVFGAATLNADTIFAIPDGQVAAGLSEEERQRRLSELAPAGTLNARIVADPDGVRLSGSARLPVGNYTIYARREGKLHKTQRTLTVTADGQLEVG